MDRHIWRCTTLAVVLILMSFSLEGTSGTRSATVLVTPVELTCSPQNATLAGYPTEPLPNGTNITLMCSAHNPTTSSLMYSWFANGELLVGENRSSLDINVGENLTIVCSVSNDVGVASVSANITVVDEATPSPTPNTTIRLVGGRGLYEGRVEVFYRGEWGTVCDDEWNLTDAEVVCRELGFSGAVLTFCCAKFGRGTGPIWLDDVQCRGNESRLDSCLHSGVGIHNCNHGEDAGVICEIPTPNTTIRLVGGRGPHEGCVEVFYRGVWGTVCDDFWDLPDAKVVCRELGFPRAISAYGRAHFGRGTGPIWLDDVQCRGNESRLDYCLHRGVGVHNCVHGEDAGVVCQSELATFTALPCLFPTSTLDVIATTPSPTPNSTIRLVGGHGLHEGRVEVFYRGEWGTVCDDGWDLADAEVVCRELGFSGAASIISCAEFGRGTGPIWLDDVQCRGNESSLDHCLHIGVGVHNCNHGEDAGVICEIPTPNTTIQLVGGHHQHEGRVEVFYRGAWGTVCDDFWDLTDAGVVCREMGFFGAISALKEAHFGRGLGPIWLDDVECIGYESRLDHCPHKGVGNQNCYHSEDAGVVCQTSLHPFPTSTLELIATTERVVATPSPTPNTTIRLVGGRGPHEGRVEVFYKGAWGTVCDDGWDLLDAEVVCRELGFPGAVSAFKEAHFGRGLGPIWLDDVQCRGYESRLDHCPHKGVGNENCHHGEDAGVVCQRDNTTTILPTPASEIGEVIPTVPIPSQSPPPHMRMERNAGVACSVRFMSEVMEVSESETELLVDVYRSGRMEEPLVLIVKDVPGTASRITDYSLETQEIVFTKTKQMEEKTMIVVKINNDDVTEEGPPETFKLVLFSDSSAGNVAEMTVAIRDDD